MSRSYSSLGWLCAIVGMAAIGVIGFWAGVVASALVQAIL